MAGGDVNGSPSGTWTWMAALAIICIAGGFLALINPFGATIFRGHAGRLGVPDPGCHPVGSRRPASATGRASSGRWALACCRCWSAFVLVADPFGRRDSTDAHRGSAVSWPRASPRPCSRCRFKPATGWVWVLASGLISAAIGLMILAGLPVSATTILGPAPGHRTRLQRRAVPVRGAGDAQAGRLAVRREADILTAERRDDFAAVAHHINCAEVSTGGCHG